MITPPRIETFGNWSPTFSNQTNNFTQTRTGSNGTTETRTINVTSSSNSSSSSEIDINKDVNSDGDMLDEINIRTITYSADNNLGSHEITEYEILNDVNNYFKIGQNTFFIGRVSAENFLNSITCDGIPANFNYDLTFYSKTENEEIYIEFFNNDSDEFLPGEYVSVFSYLNPYFNNQFDDYDQMGDYIDDNFSNQEYYDLYSSTTCSDSEYKLISIVEVEFQGNYYEVDLEENFILSVDLENQTYTISITGYIKQDSENLGSEKVELFYKGALNFEIYDSSHQPDEINDLLDPNYNQSIDDLNLNLLYDSKYHLDGRIKDEESSFSEKLGVRIDNGKLFSLREIEGVGENVGRIEVREYNDEDNSYNEYVVDYIPTLNNDFNYFSTYRTNGFFGIDKLNNDFQKIDDLTINKELFESQINHLGPSEYYTRSINKIGDYSGVDSDYYSNNYIDNNENIYFLLSISGQDPYGDSYENRFLIKYDLSNNELVWSKEIIINSTEYSYHLELNSSQNQLVMYGEIDRRSPYVILINTNNGEFMFNEILYRFSAGNPKLLGFYEDDENYLFYGPYIITTKIDKNTLVKSNFYTEQDNFDTIFCENTRAQVRGIEKYYDKYLFLTSTHIVDPNYNYANANETYNIEIRDSNGNLLRRLDLRNNKVGKPYALHKINDDTFVGLGSRHINGRCTFLSGNPRLIKFSLNYSSNSARSISSKKNIFFKKSNVIK